jgi:hypothetical protein
MKKGNNEKAFTTKAPRRQGNQEKSFNLKVKIFSWCLGALVVDSPGGLS